MKHIEAVEVDDASGQCVIMSASGQGSKTQTQDVLLLKHRSKKRIQAKSGAHVEYEAGSLSAVASFSARVEAFRLRGCVRQILLVPIPARLDVVQHGLLARRCIFFRLLRRLGGGH